METFEHAANIRWTRDLSVGSAALDARNGAMFDALAASGSMAAEATAADLTLWLAGLLTRFELLLDAEEAELAAADYRELDFHRQLHRRLRARVQQARLQAQQAGDSAALAALVRQVCADLAVRLMRHVQDADRLFQPYVDDRFRGAGP